MSELDKLRNLIDALDREILELLNRRMQTSVAIGLVKRSMGTEVFDPNREYAVLKNLLGYSLEMIIPESAILSIYSEIIMASRSLQSDRQFDAVPKLYAVLGHPIGHSLSPAMHNRAFGFSNYNGMFFAVDTQDVGKTLRALKDLDFGGAAVTMPHKETIIEHLDELVGVARDIGAVNTVVYTNGKLLGYNTDSEGAIAGLKYRTELEGKTALLIGAGGAARALAFGLKAEKVNLIITNRSREKGELLAEQAGARFLPLDDVLSMTYDIVINATSVGMYPNVDESPVPDEIFRENMVAMDIVYNPLRTKFMAKAIANGCVPLDGVTMFVHQGGKQFELWTGLPAPLPMMRQTVLSLLKRHK